MSVANIKDIIDPAFYLNRYPDLKNAYGNNHKAAIGHYMDHGVYEKRFFNNEYEEIQKGIAANTATSGQVYPYTSEYIKFKNLNTDPKNTYSIGSVRNTNQNVCRLKCNQNSECGGFSLKSTFSGKQCTLWNTNVYPDVGMKKDKKTDFFMRKREMRKFCDDECMNQKQLEELESKFDKIINDVNTAPENFAEVSKKLIIGRQGEDYYNQLKDTEYKNMSERVFSKVKELYSKENNIKMSISENYKRKIDYYQFLEDYLNIYKEKNDKLQNDMDKLVNEKNIDARKTYYEDNETQKIDNYTELFIYFYYSVFAVYTYIFISQRVYSDKKQIFLYVLFLFFPYLMYYYFIHYIKVAADFINKNKPKNVYFSKES
uniref:Apple domain-containing protein n=1 Tax=viral metagenome TaxID=1070528 RepID=A0A6C0EGE1_9ZZZZ